MVYILLGTGFEEAEAIAPCDLLRRAGIPTLTVGIEEKTVTGSHGIRVEADILLSEVSLLDLEMVVLPGGLKGVATVRQSSPAMQLLRFAWENRKYVAAICAGPTVLADLHITDGRAVTCYPGMENQLGCANHVPNAACVQDGKLITGTSAGCSIPFGLQLITALRGEDAARAVAEQIVIR